MEQVIQHPAMSQDNCSRAAVWQFYERSPDGPFGICKMCGVPLKIPKGTTGALHNHLRVHADVPEAVQFLDEKRNQRIADRSRGIRKSKVSRAAKPDDEGEDGTESEMPSFVDASGRKHSTVWRWFLVSKDNQLASCVLCESILKYHGSPASLHGHLMQHEDDPDVEAFMAAKRVSNSRRNIWKFFLKSSNKSVANCVICFKNLKITRDRTELKAHLLTHDGEEEVIEFLATERQYIEAELSNNFKRETDDEVVGRWSPTIYRQSNLKTPIWRFFLRSVDKKLAKCNYCASKLKINSGSTGSLHNHVKLVHHQIPEVAEFLATKKNPEFEDVREDETFDNSNEFEEGRDEDGIKEDEGEEEGGEEQLIEFFEDFDENQEILEEETTTADADPMITDEQDVRTQEEIVKALARIEKTLALHTELLGELLSRRRERKESAGDCESPWKRRKSFGP